MKISEFKKTRDYRDICYMIKHVPYVSTRCDILRELGYKITISMVTNPKTQVKYYTFIDNNGKIKMQINDIKPKDKFAWYVIYDGN